MARTVEYIEEYLRSHHGIVRAPLSYVIWKTTSVQTYDDNSKYATPDDEIITRMLHLPPDKNRLHDEESALEEQVEE